MREGSRAERGRVWFWGCGCCWCWAWVFVAGSSREAGAREWFCSCAPATRRAGHGVLAAGAPVREAHARSARGGRGQTCPPATGGAAAAFRRARARSAPRRARLQRPQGERRGAAEGVSGVSPRSDSKHSRCQGGRNAHRLRGHAQWQWMCCGQYRVVAVGVGVGVGLRGGSAEHVGEPRREAESPSEWERHSFGLAVTLCRSRCDVARARAGGR